MGYDNIGLLVSKKCASHTPHLASCHIPYSPINNSVIQPSSFFEASPILSSLEVARGVGYRDWKPTSLCFMLVLFLVVYIGFPFSSHKMRKGKLIYKIILMIVLKCDEVWEKIRYGR